MATVRAHFFEGPAGTGKTTAMMKALESYLIDSDLADGQGVLALTFMHGARQRLDSRLKKLPMLHGRYLCSTIDGFARRLVLRWRSLLKTSGVSFDSFDLLSFDEIVAQAVVLLNGHNVREWIARTYPVLLIDELQDVRGPRLELLSALAQCTFIIGGADEFQDLFSIEMNQAVAWMRSVAAPEALTKNHRTKNSAILDAATALRAMQPVVGGTRFKIKAVPSPNVAIALIAYDIVANHNHSKVILTPVRPEKNKWVKGIIERIETKPIHLRKQQKDVGPFRINHEMDDEHEAAKVREALKMATDTETRIEFGSLNPVESVRGTKSVCEMLNTHRRITGEHSISKATVDRCIRMAVHLSRNSARDEGPTMKAMTIHRAKNREFDGVIILWPYGVTTCAVTQRRLLYNAITRARSWVSIFVQQNEKVKNRLSECPFS